MRIAVCDDDEQEVSRIGKLLTEYETDREISVGCHYFTNSTDFLCEMRGGEYDLVLLDVLMPGVGGIQAAQELRELDKNVRLIFVSASPEFAVESYSVGAYYYLLKPISADSFLHCWIKSRENCPSRKSRGLCSRAGTVLSELLSPGWRMWR